MFPRIVGLTIDPEVFGFKKGLCGLCGITAKLFVIWCGAKRAQQRGNVNMPAAERGIGAMLFLAFSGTTTELRVGAVLSLAFSGAATG